MGAKGIKITELDFFIILIFGILALSTFVLLNSMMNLKFLGALDQFSTQTNFNNSGDFVSILIPARNEANNIGDCLESIISQDFESFEVIILDDRSTDGTVKVVESFLGSNQFVRLVKGKDLPDGWVGKNWACHQLSEHAKGQLILFMDADTKLVNSSVLSNAVTHIENKQVDLITLMPQRESGSLVEKFMYIFIDWILFSMMPINIAHKSSNMYLCATFGQFMLFRRNAFDQIGGYLEIFDNPLDDFTLGRLIKKMGLKWMLFNGIRSIKVQPYSGNSDAFKSISRSVFPAFNYSVFSFASFVLSVFLIGLFPVLVILFAYFGIFFESNLVFYAGIAYLMNLLSWLIVCLKFRHNLLFGFLNPIATFLMIIVAIHSIFSYCLKITTWKGRNIIGFKLRL